MSDKTVVMLLYGGKSGEHEISLQSALSVLLHLDPEKYTVLPIGIDKSGRFFKNKYQELLTYTKSLPVYTSESIPLPSLVENGQLQMKADVVFPVVHGPLYEDGCLQGLLEHANIAYVGCDVLSSAIAMDKDIARRLACREEVISQRYVLVSAKDTAETMKKAMQWGFPLFVKPCCLGSSVGTHKVFCAEELQVAVKDALRYDGSILVEEYIKAKEIELGVLENVEDYQRPLLTLPGEIKIHHKDGFYSYTAKYIESDTSELIIPALLSKERIERLQKMARDVFIRLKCKGMARVDFFVQDTGPIYFNEINTLPGFTTISMYPKLWEASGIPYTMLLDKLITLALRRKEEKEQLITNYQ